MDTARDVTSTNLDSMPSVSNNYHLKLPLHLTDCERPVRETVPRKCEFHLSNSIFSQTWERETDLHKNIAIYTDIIM